MAISGMTAQDQDTVCSGLEGLQNKLRFDPSGAHHPDDPDVRGIGLS